MADESNTTEQEAHTTSMRLRYDNMDTQFASQFVVNSTREEIIVNFSPGPLPDPQTNQQLLPINSRIAMTPQGAARLAKTLNNELKNMQAAAQSRTAAEDAKPESLN